MKKTLLTLSFSMLMSLSLVSGAYAVVTEEPIEGEVVITSIPSPESEKDLPVSTPDKDRPVSNVEGDIVEKNRELDPAQRGEYDPSIAESQMGEVEITSEKELVAEEKGFDTKTAGLIFGGTLAGLLVGLKIKGRK